MKAISVFRFTSFFLLFTLPLAVFSTTTADARPVSAIIYPNDAKICEHETMDVEKTGDRLEARFFLPIHANTDTLTVKTSPESGMKITSVNIEEQTLPVGDQVKTLKARLKDLNQQQSELDSKIKADSAYIDFWKTQSKNQPEKIENVDSVEKMGIAIKKGITNAFDEIYRYTQSKKDLDDQIKEVKKQLDDLTGAAKKRWQVSLSLTGNPRSKIALTYTYHIGNCQWRPTYTLNALPSKSVTEVNWYAEISQNTGIDWDGIDVKIATARAVTRPEPPDLRDWIIQPRKPIQYPKAQRNTLMAEKSVMAMAPKMRSDMVAGEAPPEPVQAPGFSFDTYDLGKRTIKAGETRRFTIREMVLNADFKYLIRPYETSQAFLFAQINLDEDHFIRLPNGNATFMEDSAFVATRSFSMHDRKQKLFFGPDPQVDVKLTTLEKKSDETGFLIGKKEYQWGWKVSVKNNKSYKIAVLMEDAYPQIRDDRIKLKERFSGMSPKKEDHTLQWEFPVGPDQEKAIEYGFSVTYPDDMDLWLGGR